MYDETSRVYLAPMVNAYPIRKKVCDRPVSDLLNICYRAVTDL